MLARVPIASAPLKPRRNGLITGFSEVMKIGAISMFWVLFANAQYVAAQDQPIFRTGVDVVAVDVTVVDDDGHPIEGLTPQDFVILVEGKPRRIVSLEFISYVRARVQEEPVEEQAEKPKTSAPKIMERNPARLVLLVVDRGTIQRGEGRVAMTAAERFLDSLSPSDLVGLFTLPPGGPRVDFTADRTRVKDALGHVAGLAYRDWLSSPNLGLSEALQIERGDQTTLEDVSERVCGSLRCKDELRRQAREMVRQVREQTWDSFTVLTELVEALVSIEEPKTLVLISEGYIQDQETTGYFRHLGRAAAAARVNLYALQFEAPMMDASRGRISPTLMDDLTLQADGMDTLAGMAGGAMFRALGSGRSAFARVEREISGYYLLGFEPEGNDRDGKPHRISVRVEREGAIVRSRVEFIIPRESAGRDMIKEILPGQD
jgi:VWFA-related protein